MKQEQPDLTLRDYLHVLRRQRFVVLGVTLLAGLAVLAYSLMQSPTYTATASLAFKDQSRDLSLLGTPASPSQDAEKFAVVRASQVKSPRVLRRVQAAL